MDHPLISIILINWNSYALTRDCLESLRKTTVPQVQIIVVDNASADGSGIQLKKDYPEIDLILSTTNKGFTGGNNLGIHRALEINSDFIMLLNNDTTVESGFLEPLHRILQQNPTIGGVQPLILFQHDRSLIWNAGGIYSGWTAQSPTVGYLKKNHVKYRNAGTTEWVSNCCTLYRADALRKVGVLNDVFFYGSFDDVDLSLRLRNAGYELHFEPESIIYHIAGMAARSDNPKKEGNLKPFVRYLVTRNNWFFIRIHTRWFQWPTVILYTTIHSMALVLFSLAKGRSSKAKAVLSGFYDGLALPLRPEKINHLDLIRKHLL